MPCLDSTGRCDLQIKTISLHWAVHCRSSYTDANGDKKIVASTQFEALDARRFDQILLNFYSDLFLSFRAFPCWDEPGLKATFTVILVIPSALTALSNMPEDQCTHLPGNKKRVQFQVSPRMSTYLVAWAVGEFDSVQAVTKNGVSLRVFSPPGRGEHGRFALDCGVRALDFFDEFFQVPYPLPKMDMICITEFAAVRMDG
jgi:aminopeptidase N